MRVFRAGGIYLSSSGLPAEVRAVQQPREVRAQLGDVGGRIEVATVRLAGRAQRRKSPLQSGGCGGQVVGVCLPSDPRVPGGVKDHAIATVSSRAVIGK